MGFLFGNDNPLHEQQVMGGVDPAVIQAVMGLPNVAQSLVGLINSSQQPMQQPDLKGASKFFESFVDNKFESAAALNRRKGNAAMTEAVGMKGPKMPDYPLRPGEAGIGIIGALLAKAFGAKDRDINDFAQGFLGSRGQAQTNQYNAAVQEHQRLSNLKKLEADQALQEAERYEKKQERFASTQERERTSAATTAAQLYAKRIDKANGMAAKLGDIAATKPESVPIQISEIRRLGGDIDPITEQVYLDIAKDNIKKRDYKTLQKNYYDAGDKRAQRMSAAWELKTFADANGMSVDPDIIANSQAYTINEQYRVKLGDKLDKEIEFFAEKEELNDANILKIKAETAAIPVRARASLLSAEASMKNANRAIRAASEKLIANPKAPNFGSQVSSMNAVINPAETNIKQMRDMIAEMSLKKANGFELGVEGTAQLESLIKTVKTKEDEIKVWKAAREELKVQWLANINASKGKGSTSQYSSDDTATATQKLNADYKANLKRAGSNQSLIRRVNEIYRQELAKLNGK